MTVQFREPEKLTQKQVSEAISIIDAIGFISNDAPVDMACKLDALRNRLKTLVNEIEGKNYDGCLIA